MIFHTGGGGGGAFQCSDSPLAPLPSSLPSRLQAQGCARIPSFPRLGTYGDALAHSFSPEEKGPTEVMRPVTSYRMEQRPSLLISGGPKG